MKIDTHQHFWRYEATDFPWINDNMPVLQQHCLPPHIAPARLQAGIEGMVAVQARTKVEETDFLLQLAREHREIWGVVGWADLSTREAAAHMERWQGQPLLKGLRHILQDEADVAAWVGNPQVQRNLHTLQQQQLVYDVLVFERQIQEVIGFCSRHDAHWLVLDHVGKPSIASWGAQPHASATWREQLQQLAALPHVMCKLSGLVTETRWDASRGLSAADSSHIHACFDHALDAFGPERLIFGSDWPVCQLAADYAQVHALADTWAATRLSADEHDAFWSGNAIRCYNLQPGTPN